MLSSQEEDNHAPLQVGKGKKEGITCLCYSSYDRCSIIKNVEYEGVNWQSEAVKSLLQALLIGRKNTSFKHISTWSSEINIVRQCTFVGTG